MPVCRYRHQRYLLGHCRRVHLGHVTAGGAVLESATIVKLTRTLAIIPITLVLAF
ncbi:MAG: hypothetical protein ACLRXC_12690 [[Clostridium] leptum]